MSWIEQVKQIEGEPVKIEGYYTVSIVDDATVGEDFTATDENDGEKLVSADSYEGTIFLTGQGHRVITWECPDSKADFVDAINKWELSHIDEDNPFDSYEDNDIKFDECIEDPDLGETEYDGGWYKDDDGKIYNNIEWIAYGDVGYNDINMHSDGPNKIHLFFDKKEVLFEPDDDYGKWQVKIDSKVVAKNIEVSELKTAIEEILL